MTKSSLSKPMGLLVSIVSVLIALVVWQILAKHGLLGKNFPGSLETLKELQWWLSDPFFNNGPNDLGIGTNLLISLRRVMIGYSLSIVVAVPLGLLIGVSPPGQQFRQPLHSTAEAGVAFGLAANRPFRLQGFGADRHFCDLHFQCLANIDQHILWRTNHQPRLPAGLQVPGCQPAAHHH